MDDKGVLAMVEQKWIFNSMCEMGVGMGVLGVPKD